MTNQVELPIRPIGGWNFDARRETWYTSIVPGRIHLTVWPDGDGDEDGDESGWRYEVDSDDLSEDNRDSSTGEQTAQDAADAAVDIVVHWMLKVAPADEMLGLVDCGGYDEAPRQMELAAILGVSQSVISDWTRGEIGMGGAVRTHIMRMAGIYRTPGAPGTTKWAIWSR